jgi:hyperosmotically inducible periplasmic protein
MDSPLRTIPLVAALAALSLAAPTVFAQDAAPAPVKSTAADNTRVNVRDKEHDTLTPMDQPNNAEDIKVAAAVRRSLTKDDSLSTMAHNIKLVAAGGVVTLRGPVASEAEKSKVEQLAAASPGVSSVQNHLDIKQ